MALFAKNTISPLIISKKLEDAVIELLKKLTKTPEKVGRLKKIWDALSAPFIVTLLGGIALACVSAVFTKCSADNMRQVDKVLAALRQRQSFIDAFDNKIDQYMRLTYSLRKREIFLDEWQNEQGRDTIKYSDGRNFFETIVQWEQEKHYLIEHWPGSPMALVHTAKVLFTNKDTLNNLDKIEKALENYDRTHDYQELDSTYNEVVGYLGRITSQFEDEAREKN